MEYEQLTAEERLKIIDARLHQYEAEHFEHALNRASLEQATDVSEEERARQLAQIDERLVSIEQSIELHRARRAETERAS